MEITSGTVFNTSDTPFKCIVGFSIPVIIIMIGILFEMQRRTSNSIGYLEREIQDKQRDIQELRNEKQREIQELQRLMHGKQDKETFDQLQLRHLKEEKDRQTKQQFKEGRKGLEKIGTDRQIEEKIIPLRNAIIAIQQDINNLQNPPLQLG